MVTQYFGFTNYRNIIFGMTGYNAGAATNSSIQSIDIPHLMPGLS